MSLECIKYHAVNKNTLLGYADFFIPKMGLEIAGCAHFRKNDQEWVGLPNREYTTKDGEKAYAPIVKFREKSHQNAFSDAARKAIATKLQAVDQGAPPHQDEHEVPF